MLEIRNLTKIYQSKKMEPVRALDNISLSFSDTGMVFLLGKSGSGKSTLLNVLGGLDKFNSGEIIIDGKSSRTFKEKDFDAYRNTYLGFIFQEYNILPEFTVEKNIEFALELQGKKADKAAVNALLEQVDLIGYGKRRPNELSGGQKQRIAIARALIKNPQIIMADEPTGALDSKTGKQVFETLKKLSREKLVIVVSHDREFAEYYGDRIIELKDGKVISDSTKRTREPSATNNGFNVVDENVIHIEKDHQFTNADVSQLIDFLKKSKSDVILTADEKLNTEVKKIAKIDENGNREYFDQTHATDIKQNERGGLKLIKSKFKFKDSFKMGASGLKTKKFRLFMTILLSAVALTLFGLADTMASFNVAQSSYASLTRMQADTLSIDLRHMRKSGSYSYAEESKVGDTELKQLQVDFPDYQFKAVRGSDWRLDSGVLGSTNSVSSYYYYTAVNGFVSMTDTEMQKYNLSFLNDGTAASRLPQADNEIVLSSYHYDLMKKFKVRYYDENKGYYNVDPSEVNHLSDIIGKTIYGWDNQPCTVVGVIDNTFDMSKYEPLKEAGNVYSQSVYNLARELQSKINSGFRNVVVVSTNKMASISKPSKVINNYDRYYSVGDGGNSSDAYWGYLDSDDTSNIIFFNGARNNGTQTLAANEVVIGTNVSVYTDEGTNSKYFSIENYQESVYNNDTYSWEYVQGYRFNNQFYATKDAVKDAVVAYYAENYATKFGNSLPVAYKNRDYSIDESQNLRVVGIYFNFNNTSTSNINDEYYSRKALYFRNMASVPSEIRYSFNQYQSILVKLLGNTNKDKNLIMALSHYDSADSTLVIRSEVSNLLENFSSMIKTMAKVFLYVGIGFAVFSALLLMNFISISISYKKKEIGILRALGARGSDVYGIFLNESLIITMINFVVAVIATIGFTILINNLVVQGLGIALTLLSFGIRQVVLLFGVSLLVALVGSFLPTNRISRMKPIDAILDRKGK